MHAFGMHKLVFLIWKCGCIDAAWHCFASTLQCFTFLTLVIRITLVARFYKAICALFLMVMNFPVIQVLCYIVAAKCLM